jgi:hypothetical protein
VRTLVTWLVCCPFLVSAQNSIDLFTLSAFSGLPAEYDPPLNGKARESGTLINLKVPIVLTEKTVWYNDFTHTIFTVSNDLSTQPQEMLTTMRLHAFIWQTGVARKLSERNGFQLLVVPRYTTDFDGGDTRNWQFGAIALYEHRSHDRLLMRYGVMYNGELSGPFLVPLVYLDWQLSEHWRVIGLLPIHMKVNYRISNRATTGFSHFGLLTTYPIGQKEFEGHYIERNSLDETLFFRWKSVGNLHLETRIGYSLSRVYEQYEEGDKLDLRIALIRIGDSREVKNVNFGNGLITSVRLVYNLPLN